MKTIKLGYGWNFSTETGCLSHPGGHLTSWFRRDGDGWKPLEWACWIQPATAEAICDLLHDPETLAGRTHLPLRSLSFS